MYKIVLASGSPRRKEILEKFKLDTVVVNSGYDEKESPGENPIQITMSHAFNKALNVSKDYIDSVVIGADTIVVYNDRILGKPKDESNAYEILNLLSGNIHEVITGIALIQEIKKIKIIDYEITKVKFRKLDSKRILNYIKTGEPLDKAGAYGIQGLGELMVEKIDGCYSNVVGLPLTKIDFYLNKYFDTHLL